VALVVVIAVCVDARAVEDGTQKGRCRDSAAQTACMMLACFLEGVSVWMLDDGI
jgi:hypothetical protein